MMNKMKRVMCLLMSLTCILVTSGITTAHATEQNKKDTTVVQEVKVASIYGTLEVRPIYYIAAPGPDDPLYSYSIKTKSGEKYQFITLGYKGDELAQHNGELITVNGTIDNERMYINVISYELDTNK